MPICGSSVSQSEPGYRIDEVSGGGVESRLGPAADSPDPLTAEIGRARGAETAVRVPGDPETRTAVRPYEVGGGGGH